MEAGQNNELSLIVSYRQYMKCRHSKTHQIPLGLVDKHHWGFTSAIRVGQKYCIYVISYCLSPSAVLVTLNRRSEAMGQNIDIHENHFLYIIHTNIMHGIVGKVEGDKIKILVGTAVMNEFIYCSLA